MTFIPYAVVRDLISAFNIRSECGLLLVQIYYDWQSLKKINGPQSFGFRFEKQLLNIKLWWS